MPVLGHRCWVSERGSVLLTSLLLIAAVVETTPEKRALLTTRRPASMSDPS